MYTVLLAWSDIFSSGVGEGMAKKGREDWAMSIVWVVVYVFGGGWCVVGGVRGGCDVGDRSMELSTSSGAAPSQVYWNQSTDQQRTRGSYIEQACKLAFVCYPLSKVVEVRLVQ